MQADPNMEFVMMMVVMPTMFLTCAWAVRGLGRYYLAKRAMTTQAEFQNKLLDKFGTSPDLLSYLQSDAGARSMQVPVVTPSAANPYARILGAVQTGVVLGFLGIAFLFLDARVDSGGESFAIVGALGLALGLGFLGSGGVAFALSKSWGLINGKKDDEDLEL